MNEPNFYYNELTQLTNNVRHDLTALFRTYQITSLVTDYDTCEDCCADHIYVHIYNEYDGSSVERQVSKVEIENSIIYVTIDDEDLNNKRCNYEKDCDSIDILSIYNACYQILSINQE